MAQVKWMTIEINGDGDKLPKNGAWAHVDVNLPMDVRREIQFDMATGRFYDRRNRAVSPKAVLNWHIPVDEKEMKAFNRSIGPIAGEQDNIDQGERGTEQMAEAIAA